MTGVSNTLAFQIFEDPVVRRNERMKANSRIALLILTVCAGLMLVSGCAQNNDVVSPQTKTTIALQPYLLPELDSVYVYELWTVKGDDYTSPSAQFTSLGKFSWDNTEFAFRSVNGDTIISNAFELPETWYEYDFVVVSIENRNDAAPSTPSGAYMLVDEVIDPKIRPYRVEIPRQYVWRPGSLFRRHSDQRYHLLGFSPRQPHPRVGT